MCRVLSTLIGVLFIAGLTQAQQKYWIYPKVKMEGKQALTAHASARNIEPIVVSEWLNAYSAILEENELKCLLQSPEIQSIQEISKKIRLLSNSAAPRLGKTLTQLKADTLIKLGLTGKGIKVGIIDAGFLGADKELLLRNIIEGNQVKAYKNYIDEELEEPYGGNASINDSHGTVVFEFLAGRNDKKQLGLAYQSEFYLARTEQADKEYHGEEDYWVAALEWMHSQGVRLINSSLGYADGFDDPSADYTQEQVDGKFSAITRAAEIAVQEKGMTIVISAGNDGNKDFRIISVPADADGVISVGSSGNRYWNKLDYSSIGPEHLDAVKPEVACYASGGTSFAAPVIAGLIACVKELKPNATNDELLNALKKSSHLYPYPNNYLGYGVPDAHKILALIHDAQKEFENHELISAKADTIRIRLSRSSNIMAFHKKDDYVVKLQEKLVWREDEVVVFRFDNAAYTTVATDEYVWEIKWPK